MNRFEWLKAVIQADVLDRAKTVATALAVHFCNDETGLLNPSLATLADYCHMTEDTARRAVADLTRGGWLGQTVGRGRGRRSSYVLLSPGNVVTLRPATARAKTAPKTVAKPAPKLATKTGKRSHGCEVSRAEKGSTGAAKRLHRCNPHIRKEQSLEQSARGERPHAHLAAVIERGSYRVESWGTWLAERGLPPLAALTALHVAGGYCLPWTLPPRKGDATQELVALNVIEWARGQGRSDAA